MLIIRYGLFHFWVFAATSPCMKGIRSNCFLMAIKNRPKAVGLDQGTVDTTCPFWKTLDLLKRIGLISTLSILKGIEKMDNNGIVKDLVKCGLSRNDIDILIKKSSLRKTSISRIFILQFLGLYIGTATLIGIYFFFIHSMNQKETIAFTCIYIPILFIIYFFTPSLKIFFWSLKVLMKLKGR